MHFRDSANTGCKVFTLIEIVPALSWRSLVIDGIESCNTVMVTRETSGKVSTWSHRTHQRECDELCSLLLAYLDQRTNAQSDKRKAGN